MEPYIRDSLLMTLVLVTLPHLACDTACHSSCKCLPSGLVFCSGDRIADIPERMPGHTYTLLLSDTKMNVIKQRSLDNMKLLLRFSLTHSHLSEIHPLAFHVAPQLLSVRLSFNDLSTFPARVFIPLTNLEQLYLNGNQLETITPDMLEGLAGLLELDLNRNQISVLPPDVFRGLTNLTFLNLGKNNIKTLPPFIFHSLSSLRQLIIYYNELESLEAGMFDGLVNLQDLRINHNQIASFAPEVFRSLRNLRNLTLSNNQLQTVPEKSFYNMPDLSLLTLYKNPLLSLPDKLMGHMPNMREFNLYATNLTTVPGNLFANMSGLLILNLYSNIKLRELPSDLFCCLPKLQELSLIFNDLHYLHPHLFSSLTSLDALRLKGNKLQSLSGTIFQSLGKLSTIDLKKNHLKTLPEDIFLSNKGLTAVSLSDNPWNCTCIIKDLARWVRDNKDVVLDSKDVTCYSPKYQILRTLDSLRNEDFDFCNAPRVTSYPVMEQWNSTPASTTTSATPQSEDTMTLEPISRKTTSTVKHQTPSSSSSSSSTSLEPPIADELPDSQDTRDRSPPFYDKLVVEQGPEFVHHNFHSSWVYVWFLPSDTTLVGLLMFCHILLVATAFFVILASIYAMYRLNKVLEELEDKPVHMHG